MTTKHPERRPVDQVEGVIHVSDLEGKRLLIEPKNTGVIDELIQVMSATAERQVRERKERNQARRAG